MRIKRLLIKNFRPYKNVEIDIDSHIKRIILLGQNDIGKTELLNAIYWCIWGKPLTKLRPFSQWKNEIKSGNKVTGIFNNSAFDNLKQSEILHVCVTLTFELDKNELHDVERDDGLLELSRSIFIEKDSKDSPRFLKLTDDDEEIGFYSNFPVKSTKTFSMFEEDLTMSSWFGHFTLSSTTKNSNLEKSDEPNIDKYKYFPSDEITKFFLLDSTLLRDYLSFKQNENKSNIDNITKVGDLNKLKEKITIVSNEIMKEINKVNKEGENTERDKLEDERNSLLLELDRLNRDIDEVELFDIWTENFKQRMNGVAPKNPFNLDRCGAIKELKCRLKFNDTIINKETQTGADTSEGKELLVNRKNKEISLKNNQRTYNDKKIDISDNYFRLNIMQNTKDNINKFSENNNVLEYTPPKVTKNFLKELIETKLCCCGSELDPKKNKDRVEAIEDLMSKLVDKGTSSQISQIKSRAQDFYNPDQFELIIERLEIDISDAGDAYDQIDNLQKDIKNINIESNENYQIINFDQISVNESANVGGKPAIKYTLDLFVAQPHVGVNGTTKHLIIVFYIVEEDNPNKAGSKLPYSDDDISEIKAQVESVTLANAEPYPTKIFFDETYMKQENDNIIIDDTLIKSNDNVVMGVNESSIPFGLFKSCKMSKDSKENGGPVDCDKQFNLQEKIFPAQIQERQELNGLINNVMHENQHARFLYYQNANKSGRCAGLTNDLSNHTILGEPTENSWLFEKSRDRISRSHGTTI